MKKTIAIVLALLLVFTMVSCAANNSTETSDPEPSTTTTTPEETKTEEKAEETNEKTPMRIAFSLDAMTEGMKNVLDAVQKSCDEFNASQDEIEASLTVFDANGDVAKQIADVETIIVDDYDCLVFSCVDSVGSLPAAKAAVDAGIYVIDSRDMGDPDACTVTVNMTNEELIASMMRDWLQKMLDEDPDLVLNIGLAYGAAAQIPQLERGNFAKRWAEEEERVNIIAEGYADWDAAKAQALAEDWIQAHPEMNVIIAANTTEAQGVEQAIKGAQMEGKITVVTFDISQDACERIKAGSLGCTVGMDQAIEGRIDFELCLKLFTGEWDGSKVYLNDDQYCLDATNVDAYLAGHTIG